MVVCRVVLGSCSDFFLYFLWTNLTAQHPAANTLHYSLFHLSADFSLSELMAPVNCCGSPSRPWCCRDQQGTALSQHPAPIPTDGNWANPSGLWGSHWLFTYFLNSAITSVYIPFFMVNWEQERIPNFLHSKFAWSILMWFAVMLHRLFSLFVGWDSQLPELWFPFILPSISSSAHQDAAVRWLQSVPDAYIVLTYLQPLH